MCPHADPDFAEPPEAHNAEDGVRYLQARVVSEADGTPDVTEVTFVICDATLVTVRYDESDSFELFGKKLCRFWGQALMPDAIAVGLVNTIINMPARALGRVGDNLDRIGSAVFKAPGDNSKRSAVYSATLDSLGREDERNLKSPGEPALDRAAAAVPVGRGKKRGNAEAGVRGNQGRAA